MIELEDKLYTSDEVASILNVTLRTLYRYLERGYIVPDVQLMSGRYRFSKKNIEELLSKRRIKAPAKEREKVLETESEAGNEPLDLKEIDQSVKEAEVFDLPKNPTTFFAPPKKDTFLDEDSLNMENESLESSDRKLIYCKSPFNSLKTVAKIINQTSKVRGVPYAFTMEGGLSLYEQTHPFSTVYAYVSDPNPFIAALQAEKCDKEEASICFILTEGDFLLTTAKEEKGLSVVSKEKIMEDLSMLK
ncbi:hypothetical protein COY33_01075 [candidate division WWE3 bacterium CG_4_10_14_0_2_um_filter_42_7]|uniref:Helix-turn-helix domain-containing protein n=2 Tax=Katanobacteria TaxID=422282 RepID=A0A2H0XBR1_UNCKA|nr:MAG: hypothetical protein COT51_01705 [candidate division WWE3 bacterium CG08_land_8_20_14_0_20_41_15]PIZ43743.1 MAG: hypothetical protein COY33_01075 [candidate division WWE3 bacterium CG_4_10_14_0_2_um_filter_42_7]